LVALLHGRVCGDGRRLSRGGDGLPRWLVFPVCLSTRNKRTSQLVRARQSVSLPGQGFAHPVLLFLVALDVAAFSLRSVDGHRLEMADSVGADQYRVVGICNLRGAGFRWVSRVEDD